MSIVESESPRRNRVSRLEKLAGTAILAAAAFAATPKLAHANTIADIAAGGTNTNPNGTGAVSWFNITNWNDITSGNTGATGTLPEVSSADTAGSGGAGIAQANAGVIGTTTGVPSVGVVFDPADDSLTPGGPNANYVANVWNTWGSFFVGVSGPNLGGTVTSTPSKLTVESGTLIANAITLGRDQAATLVQNGGYVIVGGGGILKVQGFNKTTAVATATYEYHGGSLLTSGLQVVSGGCTTGMYQTSAGVGTFVVYNDGPDGAILTSNGFSFDSNTKGKAEIGFVEFHYDLNTGGIGGTRPIQANWSNGSSLGTTKLALLNGTASIAPGSSSLPFTTYSTRLNLVLDTAPSILNGFVQNLGLFDETLISGNGTFPKAFYSADGSTVFTQGATISAVYSGNTYSWTISYSGQIQFTNTAVSGYNSSGIFSTGGNDVVLVGLSVPEPSSLALLGGAGSLILSRRRKRKDEAEKA